MTGVDAGTRTNRPPIRPLHLACLKEVERDAKGTPRSRFNVLVSNRIRDDKIN
jgi:hypothetical protein